MKPFAFVSDFDNTLTHKDFYHIVIDKYLGQAGKDLYADWKRTRKINVEFLNLIFSSLKKTENEIREEILAIPFDKKSIDLVRKIQGQGGDFFVVSAGTSYYIKILFEHLKISDVQIISMEGAYKDGGIHITPDVNSPFYSEVFGIDKGKVLQDVKKRYTRVYFAGDSEPDLGAARNADVVFAKGELSELMENEGLPFVPYHDYGDIELWAAQRGWKL